MPTGPTCVSVAKRAIDRIGRALLPFGVAAAVLTSCGTPPSPATGTAPVAQTQPPKTVQPFEQAIASLTDALLAHTQTRPPERRVVVIDPLIERASGYQTATTRSIGAQIERRVRDRYPQFEMHPFNTASLADQPLIFLGSIAPVAQAGSVQPATGLPTVYRIWAVIADLRTNRVLGREMAWVKADDVNATPLTVYGESPVWSPDPVAAAYIRTCSSTAGTPIDPVYLQALRAQALIVDAITLYDAGQYREALERYDSALKLPGGEQLRVLNGIYLADMALARPQEAQAAFARIVDYGLTQGRLGVKLLFRPGSTQFWPDPAVSRSYPMWIREIAQEADVKSACLKITGHTSLTGPPAFNDQLSLKRAQRVQGRLVADRPPLRNRTEAEGLGSREPIVGTGTDDARDALDRRVEFQPHSCAAVTSEPESASPARS